MRISFRACLTFAAMTLLPAIALAQFPAGAPAMVAPPAAGPLTTPLIRQAAPAAAGSRLSGTGGRLVAEC